uniref:Uncharacterized protein n=1 Tax=Arundo donax TaxID=35708 RepID=A0A0A9BYI6_ARUDO
MGHWRLTLAVSESVVSIMDSANNNDPYSNGPYGLLQQRGGFEEESFQVPAQAKAQFDFILMKKELSSILKHL